ncbi:hypothetical protein RU639_000987 [Aspergillus parasiticus]
MLTFSPPRVSTGSPKLVKESIPVPAPGPGQVLVKVSHVAQNPTDVQSFDSNAFGDGTVLGCDFVGEVVQIGVGVTRLTKGDIVGALIWGGETKGLGAYSEYCLTDQRIAFKVPTALSREDASTIPLTAATAWLALFSQIVSVSTVQTHRVQVCWYGEVAPVSVCTLSKSPLFMVLGSRQGSICTVRPGKANTEGISEKAHVTDVLVWTAFLKEHRYGKFHWPASERDHELAIELFEKLGPWLEEGMLKPNATKVLSGLDAVSGGFQKYRDRKISAYRIVYQI